MMAQHYVSAGDFDFTYENIAALQDAYYGEGANHQIHMSDVEGWICWKSLGEIENRKLANHVHDSCEREVLTGEGVKEKCDALYEVVGQYAEPTRLGKVWDDYVKPVGAAITGLAGVWAVFGPGMTLWHKISTRAGGLPLLLLTPLINLEMQMMDPCRVTFDGQCAGNYGSVPSA